MDYLLRYRLSSKITVRDAAGPQNDPASERRDPPTDGGNTENNERQQWAIQQMRVGIELRKTDIADHFECSKETARRDLKDLRRRGLIEFIGPSRTGHWRLVC